MHAKPSRWASCVRTAKAVTRLVAYVISTIISWAGSIILQESKKHLSSLSNLGIGSMVKEITDDADKQDDYDNDDKDDEGDTATAGTTWILKRLMTKPTKWSVRPAKTQISLGIRLIRVFAVRMKKAWVLSYRLSALPRLIWVFAGHTVILLVLLWGGSIVKITSSLILVCPDPRL